MNRPEARLDELAAVVRDLEPQLDELARARIQARLLSAIDREAAAPARSLRQPVLASVAVMAAAAAALLMLGRDHSERPSQAHSAKAPRQAPSALPTDALIGRPQSALDVPERSLLRASLGERVRLTLRGPAHLELIDATAVHTELVLSQGELALDYDGHLGGELVVRTPDARVRVVGTRLLVAVTAGKTRVGVASGMVTVESRSRVLSISAGSEWRSDQEATTALSPELRDAMHEHGQALVPPPARTTSVELYRRAEHALGAHDRAAARQLLRQLLARFPNAPESEPARYELAQLASGCPEQRRLLSAYLAQYPSGRFVTGARERLARCE